MIRLFRIAPLIIFLIYFSGAVVGAASHLVPPNVTSVVDIPYPINSVGAGLVSLAANLSPSGRLQSAQVLRDIPGLTSQAVAAVDQWSFSPARTESGPVPSILNIAIVFNPGNPQQQSLQFAPALPIQTPNPPGYAPPEVSTGVWASYPVNSIGAGAVVLSVSIDAHGSIKKVDVIRGVPSLTGPAIAALKKWTITPATYQGQAIKSRIVVAFVFRTPTITTP